MNFTCLGTISEKHTFIAESDSHFKSIFGYFQIGERIQITVKKFVRKRSNPQNSFYWGVVIPAFFKYLQEAGGYENVKSGQDVHENILALLFLQSTKINSFTGEVITYTKSSAELDTVEFAEFLENSIRWIFEKTGLIIPYPNES